MILKKLEIQGFKSFAERTEINFSSGVIAVVGPNGSGKSNISDAILWVLGEQNVRNIRGEKAQDVIFNGTDKRRPVGLAEVSLTVDNTSGRLPIDFSEVTVTRRAYRSGDSEFLINKTPCRLKDIYELFLDTGVGRGAYSIVSQGEIDAMLSANPEDRRALFDEAAGIKKYRVRKREAVRKLESTQQNLNRVNDIVNEIDLQIEPMREQAESAARYLELTSRLNEIETGILVNDLQRFSAEIEHVHDENVICDKEVSDSDALLTALEEEKTALAVDLANADAQVERYQAMHQEAVTRLERTESQIALVKQRNEAAANAAALLEQEIEQLQGRVAEAEKQKVSLSLEDGQVSGQEKALNDQLALKTVVVEDLQRRIEESSQANTRRKANYIELAKQLAAQRNELTNNASRIESLQALLSKRDQEVRDAEKSVAKANDERDHLCAECESVRSKAASVAAEMASARASAEAGRKELAELIAESQKSAQLVVDRRSRLGTLREMEEAREGYYLGVKSTMSAVKSGEITGSYSVVADVIKVPRGYETAFEVALGGSLQDIITDSEGEAKAGIEFLKRNKVGRATFLPLNLMRHSVSPHLKDLVGKNGVLGLGNELVKFDAKYRPAIDALLAKVVVAKDVESALAASKAAIGWSKIVTLDGELITPSGAMTGGTSPGKGIHLLNRKQEIISLESEVKDLQRATATQKTSMESLQRASDTLVAKQEDLEEQDTALKMTLLEIDRRLDYSSRELTRLVQDMETLVAEREDAQENLLKARERDVELRRSLAVADKDNRILDDTMAEGEQELRHLQEEHDALNAEIGRISVLLAGLTQKRLSIEQTLDTSDGSIRQMIEEAYRKKDRLARIREEIAATVSECDELESSLIVMRDARDDTRAQSDQWQKTKKVILDSSMEVSDRMKEIGRRRDELVQKIHASELKEARLEVQIAQATARLLEEYDITPEDALHRAPPEVRHGSATEVMRLRREIRDMGEVNTGAIQEFSRLTERYGFLNGQRQDLLDARQKLTDAIREIDEGTRGVFVETLEQVRTAFDTMFKRMFGGGATELSLTDPEDVLESGIDVTVHLPSKKRQSLELLSGGERALTAAALMFALLSIRPSPFCLLDEVDAPLDEANVERFADIVKEFARQSQMIVITHNKATMEAADVLYGVTMQEPGISRLVSVKLSDMAEKSVS